MSEQHDPGDRRVEAIDRLIASAESLGVEIDRAEAERWIAAVSAESTGGNIMVDVDSGIYGHRVTMADSDPADLDRFRRMATVVGFEDRPPQVTTALALAGSAAQARVHRFPADADFFERIHIRADTREEAGRILAELMRDKALSTLRGDGHKLHEVKFGNWPVSAETDGGPVKAGSPISWTPAQVEAGKINYRSAGGLPGELRWEDAAADPGWCKLDWVIAVPDVGLSNASNMLDVTWEAPDGTITPLDGFLDPYFQEVYLETESIPLFSKLVKEMGADSVADYVEQLNGEVYKYTIKTPNYGKAARRMYNVFRITGKYPEAAFVRELFDEPVTALYQVSALLRTVDDAARSEGVFDTEQMVAQIDALIVSAIAALEGREEAEMVRRLTRLREAIASKADAASREADIDAIQDEALDEVNAYFQRILVGVPSIREYLQEVAAAHE